MKELCKICKKIFNIKPYHKKRYKGPFCCSRKCRGELLKEVYTGNSNPNYKYLDEISKLLAIRCSDIQRRSEKNNIPFDLTPEFLRELFEKQNGLCAYSGIPLKPTTTNFKEKGQADPDVMSVDKVVPELGYVKTNVVLCCSAINKLKGNSNPEELQQFLTAIGLKTFGTCKIKIKKVRDNAQTPFRASLGDGGYDLFASKVEDLGDKIKVYTGIVCQPDLGWVLLALPRSSSYKKGIRLTNSVGLIDNQYRGEIMAIFDKKDLNAKIEEGDRVVQLMPVRLPYVELEEVNELEDSQRGTGGFGSSGK